MKPSDPAFPNDRVPSGLTIRQYAAIHICAGLCADPSFEGDVQLAALRITNGLLDKLGVREDLHGFAKK